MKIVWNFNQVEWYPGQESEEQIAGELSALNYNLIEIGKLLEKLVAITVGQTDTKNKKTNGNLK